MQGRSYWSVSFNIELKTGRVWKQDIYFFYFFKNMVGEKSNSAGNCCLHLPQTTGGS